MTDCFGKKLKKFRKSKNLTQEQLAQKLFVSSSVIISLEKNQEIPSDELLQKISAYFMVPVEDFCKKKTFPYKKLGIILSSVLVVIILIAVSLGIIYHPRTLSECIKANNKNFEKLEVKNYDGTIFTFDEETQKKFYQDVLQITVVPRYVFVNKVISSFDIVLTYTNKTYVLNQYYIYDGKNRNYYEPVNYSMYSLVCQYVGENI